MKSTLVVLSCSLLVATLPLLCIAMVLLVPFCCAAWAVAKSIEALSEVNHRGIIPETNIGRKYQQ